MYEWNELVEYHKDLWRYIKGTRGAVSISKAKALYMENQPRDKPHCACIGCYIDECLTTGACSKCPFPEACRYFLPAIHPINVLLMVDGLDTQVKNQLLKAYDKLCDGIINVKLDDNIEAEYKAKKVFQDRGFVVFPSPGTARRTILTEYNTAVDEYVRKKARQAKYKSLLRTESANSHGSYKHRGKQNSEVWALLIILTNLVGVPEKLIRKYMSNSADMLDIIKAVCEITQKDISDF